MIRKQGERRNRKFIYWVFVFFNYFMSRFSLRHLLSSPPEVGSPASSGWVLGLGSMWCIGRSTSTATDWYPQPQSYFKTHKDQHPQSYIQISTPTNWDPVTHKDQNPQNTENLAEIEAYECWVSKIRVWGERRDRWRRRLGFGERRDRFGFALVWFLYFVRASPDLRLRRSVYAHLCESDDFSPVFCVSGERGEKQERIKHFDQLYSLSKCNINRNL